MMVNRFEVAEFFKDTWELLCWKGNLHTKGVYFNDEFGYMIDRGFAVRKKHDEPAPPVFYVPGNDDDVDDEVYTEYPYTNMMKINRSFHPLFKGNYLPPDEIERIFAMDPAFEFTMKLPNLQRLPVDIPVKRERDRAWVKLTIAENLTGSFEVYRQKEDILIDQNIEIFSLIGCNGRNENVIYSNANTFLHVVSLFDKGEEVVVSVKSNKIKISNHSNNIEAIISMPKHVPDKERDGPD